MGSPSIMSIISDHSELNIFSVDYLRIIIYVNRHIARHNRRMNSSMSVVRKRWAIGVIRLIRAGQVTGVREWPVQSANESARSRRIE